MKVIDIKKIFQILLYVVFLFILRMLAIMFNDIFLLKWYFAFNRSILWKIKLNISDFMFLQIYYPTLPLIFFILRFHHRYLRVEIVRRLFDMNPLNINFWFLTREHVFFRFLSFLLFCNLCLNSLIHHSFPLSQSLFWFMLTQ